MPPDPSRREAANTTRLEQTLSMQVGATDVNSGVLMIEEQSLEFVLAGNGQRELPARSSSLPLARGINALYRPGTADPLNIAIGEPLVR